MADEQRELQEGEYAPNCPTCGEKATFRDSMGYFWDANAHRWKEIFEEARRG